MPCPEGTEDMNWSDVLSNVIVPIGMALVLAVLGIVAAKLVARRPGGD
jgi:hypothetical protein